MLNIIFDHDNVPILQHFFGWIFGENTTNVDLENKVGQRTQKQGGTQHTIFKKPCGM